MAAELERQQALRQSLVHDVAHELRTPLTALQCRLEAVIDGLARDPVGSLSALHEQVLHLSKLVDDLQDLALAEAREVRLQPESVRVADLVASAIRATSLEHDERVRLEIPDDLHMPCSRQGSSSRPASSSSSPAATSRSSRASRRRSSS